MLNISKWGIVEQDELADLSKIQEELVPQSLQQFPEFIVGIKARMSKTVIGTNGITPLELAKKIQQKNALSVGLGAGDPNQSQMVSRISSVLQPQHINQVFTGAATSRALLGQEETIINSLVSPTGKVGYVNIATGPLSSKEAPAEVPLATAIALLKDLGASSIKYFPMKGLAHKDEYEAVAKACAEHDFYLEPTGGIDLDNFEEIVQIAVDAGVKKIIPHVYSSIIDAETGDTRPEDVQTLLAMAKNTLK
ncbi:2-dehydro-3-deoxy-phosphogluconate aldolase [Enterococcus saccharolyticus]|uniref:2-dehydro-3-deoxy-phosphogluconate aldolase n=1 Tax=Enterococcus saccharolyticus TaxID=41997 RepID=UPI0039E0A25E